MAEATDKPHQISYEDICKYTGKMFLESQYEIERIRAMLFELQTRLNIAESTKQEALSESRQQKQKILELETLLKQARET
jgi:hypothetical protein